MCVSAEVSFAVGALLLPAGVYCVHAAVRKKRASLALAAIPLFFGLQQWCEGVTWLGLERNDPALIRLGALGFLFFALAFWPFWPSLGVWLIEAQPSRKWLIGVLMIGSLAWGWILYYPLATDAPRWLTVQQVHHSVQYRYPDLPVYSFVSPAWLRLFYLLTIVSPFVLCSDRGLLSRSFVIFGTLLAASALLSHLVFAYAFVSVWCFCAALLALYLCWIFRTLALS
jgi:hypothetical protein